MHLVQRDLLRVGWVCCAARLQALQQERFGVHLRRKWVHHQRNHGFNNRQLKYVLLPHFNKHLKHNVRLALLDVLHLAFMKRILSDRNSLNCLLHKPQRCLPHELQRCPHRKQACHILCQLVRVVQC